MEERILRLTSRSHMQAIIWDACDMDGTTVLDPSDHRGTCVSTTKQLRRDCLCNLPNTLWITPSSPSAYRSVMYNRFQPDILLRSEIYEWHSFIHLKRGRFTQGQTKHEDLLVVVSSIVKAMFRVS